MEALKLVDDRAHISKIFVTCSSPWAYTVARSAQYQSNEPFKVTKSIITDLVLGAEHEIFAHVAEVSGRADTEYTIVEKATVDISINDYPVTAPFGLKGTSLGLSHIAGLIPKELLDITEEAQEKVFPEAEMRAHTYMLVIYCVVRDILPKTHSVCIVDVTGDATEFGIVEHNLLIDNTYIPHGTQTLIRNVAKAKGNPLADLESQLSEYTRAVCTDETPLGNAVAHYRAQLTQGINTILEHRSLPKTILITAHAQYQAVCKAILEDTLREMGLGTDHEVITLPESTVSEVMQGTSPDVYLAMSARFFHKLHGCADITEVE
jgi:hypothetical protein